MASSPHPTAKPDTTATLRPLPDEVHKALTAISFTAFTSLFSAAFLFAYLSYRLLSWKQRGYAHINQYMAILINLIFADLMQGIAFSLSAHWLREGAVIAGSRACVTQGWFINAGDVGSCLFTLAMAVHLFCDVVLDRRLRYGPFLGVVIGLWTFNIFLASIGMATHPTDFYKRAGMWCWINEKYMHERIWFHYLWVLITEFGTIFLYSMMFIVIWRRVRSALWATNDQELRHRAMNAAKTVITYPIAYVICTLPIVVARLGIITGRKVSITELAVAGFFLTSNGWVDVLLYTTTRRSLIFGPPLPQEAVRPLDTFEFADVHPPGDHAYPYGAHGKIAEQDDDHDEAQWSKEKQVLGKKDEIEVTTQDLHHGSVSSEDVCEGEDIIRAEDVAQVQKEFRDFTAELAAVWRPRSKGRDASRPPPQPLDWEQFERVCDEHGRHRERYSRGAGSKDSNDSMASAILPPPASANRDEPQRR